MNRYLGKGLNLVADSNLEHNFENTLIQSFDNFLFEPTEKILNNIEKGNWQRADGDCLCKCCLPYKMHKNVRGDEWLTILCDLTLVKL